MVRLKIAAVLSLLLLCALPISASAQGLLERAIDEYRAENYEEAQELLSQALKADPGSARAYYYKGLTLKRMGNIKAAIPSFKAALKQIPPEKAACLELAAIYLTLDEYEQAADWLQQAEKNGARPAEVAMLRGMLLMRQKRHDDAIAQFSAAKAAEPALAPTADFQIAMAHASARRLEQARASLKTVITISPDSDMAEYARDYEKTFANVVKDHRTWRGTVFAGYLYDDNVFGKPRSEIAGIVFPKNRDNAFVGNFRLDYTPFLEGRKLFSAQYALNTSTYGQRSEYDQISNSISMTLGISLDSGALTAPITYSHYLLGQDPYMQQIATRPTWYLMLVPGHILQTGLGYSRREMLKKPLSPEENRDANIFSGTLGYLYTFAEGRGFLNLRYELSDDVAEGKNWHNLGNRFSALALIPVWKGVSVNLSGDVALQNYQNSNSYFSVRRNDTLWSMAAGVSWEAIKGVKLNAQYGHTRAESNINIYDYTRNTIMCGLELNF